MSDLESHLKIIKNNREQQNSFGGALKWVASLSTFAITTSLYKIDYLRTLEYTYVIGLSILVLSISAILAIVVIILNSITGSMSTGRFFENAVAGSILLFCLGFIGITGFVLINIF